MQLLLDKNLAARALSELQDVKYDKYFNDDIRRKTRGHIASVMKILIDEGAEGLDRTYRKQKSYAQGLGSSSLMLGIFLWTLAWDPKMNKSMTKVYQELYKQWGEFPYPHGLMFGISLLGVLLKRRVDQTDEAVVLKAEKILREFCEDGNADRGLTCLWILLRGYVKDKLDA